MITACFPCPELLNRLVTCFYSTPLSAGSMLMFQSASCILLVAKAMYFRSAGSAFGSITRVNVDLHCSWCMLIQLSFHACHIPQAYAWCQLTGGKEVLFHLFEHNISWKELPVHKEERCRLALIPQGGLLFPQNSCWMCLQAICALLPSSILCSVMYVPYVDVPRSYLLPVRKPWSLSQCLSIAAIIGKSKHYVP